jgi:hypothetical protein
MCMTRRDLACSVPHVLFLVIIHGYSGHDVLGNPLRHPPAVSILPKLALSMGIVYGAE